jgi:nucleotide-binding universal stress UspA family protein
MKRHPMPLTHLLATTDFSEPARHAVDRAMALAQASGARVTLAHALGLESLSPLRGLLSGGYEAVEDRIRDDALAQLTELAGALRTSHAIEPALRVEAGLAGWAMPALAQETGADLVVTGARGGSGLQRLLLGSTAAKLLRKCHCPVLVVKNPATAAYQRVLVAVDFSPASATAIGWVRTVAPDAELVLVHIFDVPFEGKLQYAGVKQETIYQFRADARARAVQQMEALADAAGLERGRYTGLVLQGDAAAQILHHADAHRCDLVAMGKHGTHLTEDLLLGSVTSRVLAESTADLLVVVDTREPHLPLI